MRLLAFWQPLRRKLPFLIIVLLFTALGAFSWLAYRELATTLVATAHEHALNVAGRLAAAFAQSEESLKIDPRRVETNAALAWFIQHPDQTSERDAVAALEYNRSASSQIVMVELWDRKGRRLLTASRPGEVVSDSDTARVTSTFVTGSLIGPLVERRDTVLTEARIAVINAYGDTVGVVRQFQHFSPRSGALVRQLIGSDAVVFLGNRTGGLWTDMSRRVQAPAKDGKWIDATANVPGVPWVVWVALPRAAVLGPANALLGRIALLAVIVVAIGGLAAWMFSARLTRPLAELIDAAGSIASGDYSRRVTSDRSDEVGQLTAVFNNMASRVEQATLDLESQAIQLARFQSVVETATDAIFTTDAEGRIQSWNAAAQRTYGYTAREAIGAPLSVLIPPDKRGDIAEEYAELVGGSDALVSGGLVVRDGMRKDGFVFPVELSVSRWKANGATFVTSVVRDISGRAALEARLAHQASHDGLTGLANRGRFRERLAAALSSASDRPEQVAVLFLDLDDFKTVNDTAGHAAGDELLANVTDRLLSATRGTDAVARLGGDEFGILLSQIERAEDVDTVAARIITAIRRPMLVGPREIVVTASIGVARGERGSDADSLLQNADTALYVAKDRGKGMYVWFAPAMHQALVARAQVQGDIGPALERDEFWLAYQPIVALSSERVEGLEALVRWEHPIRGALSPADFISVAESSGQIVPLGRWVLCEACRTVARLPGTPYVTVNISARQLENPSLVDDVSAALEGSGLAPERLLLEITETVLMADTKGTLERLQALKALGVRLGIDDFGTGYSSLRYLQRFPVDVLKIDKSFVDGVDRDDHDAALVRTIVALGEMLGLETVAEGIERGTQRDLLRAIGCRRGQGYFFARPLDALATAGVLGGDPSTVEAETALARP
jgi:diguanylate cyclase (GGDEF)-like protein/PAS domain S-box-containing protein